jgi:hypothetical protein
MTRNQVLVVLGMSCVGMTTLSCKRDESPVAPGYQPTQQGLSAVPSTVSVSSSQSRNVSISGGIQPYAIVQAPSASLASATIVDANRDTIVLSISGVTTATGSTAVVVRDATTPQPKSVSIAITKF